MNTLFQIPQPGAAAGHGLIIDNFAGGGGASTGIEAGIGRAVDVAINHDEAAIAVHAANHPGTKHYCQSIFSVDPRDATGGAPVLLAWFSPDCKHHSKAKGGKPRDKNIRDMAWVVPHWIDRLLKSTPNGEGAPQVIMLENVEEFRQWGPLDADGKPIRARQGEEFNLWIARIRKLGYKVEHRDMRACDYGAPTSRKRLFLIARRDGKPIRWPAPTHGKPGSPGVVSGSLLPWRAAAECIDWSIPCPSIFGRKIPLKDATCRRLAAGTMRYVVNSAKPFIVPLTHAGGEHHGIAAATMVQLGYGEREGQEPRALDIEVPLGTVVAGGGKHGLVSAFLEKFSENSRGRPATAPLDTVMAGAPRHAVIAAHLEQANGGGVIGHDVRQPVSTITITGSRQRLVKTVLVEAGALPPQQMERAVTVAAFLVKYYGSEIGQHQAATAPLDTITAKPRFAVITVTIDAVTYVLVDIGMRMLTPRELANAQGFPADYILDPLCWYVTDSGARKFGHLPKTHQVSKIGNSVCPPMAAALVRANFDSALAERVAA